MFFGFKMKVQTCFLAKRKHTQTPSLDAIIISYLFFHVKKNPEENTIILQEKRKMPSGMSATPDKKSLGA